MKRLTSGVQAIVEALIGKKFGTNLKGSQSLIFAISRESASSDRCQRLLHPKLDWFTVGCTAHGTMFTAEGDKRPSLSRSCKSALLTIHCQVWISFAKEVCVLWVIPIGYFLRKLLFAAKTTLFSRDFYQQNGLYRKKSISHSISSTCGRNMSPKDWILLSK